MERSENAEVIRKLKHLKWFAIYPFLGLALLGSWLNDKFLPPNYGETPKMGRFVQKHPWLLFGMLVLVFFFNALWHVDRLRRDIERLAK